MSERRHALQWIGGLALVLSAPRLVLAAGGPTIVAVRVWPAREYTRVTIESDTALSARHGLTPAPERLTVDIDGLELKDTLRELIGKVRPDDPFIAGVRVGQYQPRVVRIVFDLKQPVRPQQFTLTPVAAYRHRLVFDLFPVQEADPLLALVRDKESGERKAETSAAREMQQALDELIARVGTPAASAAPAPAGAASTVSPPDTVPGKGGVAVSPKRTGDAPTIEGWTSRQVAASRRTRSAVQVARSPMKSIRGMRCHPAKAWATRSRTVASSGLAQSTPAAR